MCPLQESETFQTIVVFECRGLEPVDFDPRVDNYLAKSLGSEVVFSFT